MNLPGTSPLIHGSHEPPPPDVMPDGWILFLEDVGHSPEPHPGVDFGAWEQQGYGIICRIQHEWGSGGTLPKPDDLAAYVERVRTLVQNSRFCHRWIIGNEPSNKVEWPDGWPLQPEYVAQCYNFCWQAIHDLPGHEFDEVLVAPIGPWNIDTGIPWIEYFQRTVEACEFVDGIALHAYTHGSDLELITSEAMMNPPFENEHYEFRVYRDWMHAIPENYRARPVYLTETNQDGPWLDRMNGWIPEMYREIDDWNQSGQQVIRAAILYRYPHHDDYYIEGKHNTIADFRHAQSFKYTWLDVTDPPTDPPEEEEMLKNPSFEEGWHEQGASQLVLPDEWAVEYLEGAFPWHRPEIKPNEEFATDGRFSIRAFAPEHSRTRFGIWQEIDAEPGQWYKFSADVRLESKKDGRLAGFVGIQPWGAGIFKRQMIWGEETQAQIEWQRVEVVAQAFGGKIRVAMGATNDFATRNNTTWWDNASLEEWECDGGTDPEPPDPPVGGECKFDKDQMEQMMRRVVGEELEKRVLAFVEIPTP